MGAYPVTVGNFRQFLAATGYKTEARRATRGQREWTCQQAFGAIATPSGRGETWGSTRRRSSGSLRQLEQRRGVRKWLSRREGRTYRLPTEAESEYCCRAGTTTRFYNGEGPEKLAEIANVADQDYRAVFPPAFGCKWTEHPHRRSRRVRLHRTCGEVPPKRLWPLRHDRKRSPVSPQDWYNEEYYQRSPIADPPGPKSGAPPAHPAATRTCGSVFQSTRGARLLVGPRSGAAATAPVASGNHPECRNNGTGFRVGVPSRIRKCTTT